MLARMEAEQEKEGKHPRSIAQIRRANAPDDNRSQLSTKISSERGKRSHPTSLDCLCSPEERSSEINVICSWATLGQKEKLIGQHHLRQLAVRPEYSSKGCPILISANYNSEFSHDFSQSPLVSMVEINNFILSFILCLSVMSSQSFRQSACWNGGFNT